MDNPEKQTQKFVCCEDSFHSEVLFGTTTKSRTVEPIYSTTVCYNIGMMNYTAGSARWALECILWFNSVIYTMRP